MIQSAYVLKAIWLGDPHPLPEEALRVQVGEMLGHQVGIQELTDALRRLAGYRYIAESKTIDGDSQWELTADGRTEAQKRFR